MWPDDVQCEGLAFDRVFTAEILVGRRTLDLVLYLSHELQVHDPSHAHGFLSWGLTWTERPPNREFNSRPARCRSRFADQICSSNGTGGVMTGGLSTSSALTESTFAGHRPARAGDLSVETHGIAPIAEDQRYGTPRRLFTVWFAPQVNMTGVFTGTLAIVLGLGFWLGLLAMVIGTVLGSLVVGYLSTWGPRTGAGQLPNARMAFGGAVVLPGALQWLSSIAWDA